MSNLFIYILLSLLVLSGIFFIAVFLRKIKDLHQRLDSQELVLSQQQLDEADKAEIIEKLTERLDKTSLESQQVTEQLSIRTKNIQKRIDDLSKEIEQLNHQQPEDRLYRRALKMVELGADIDEIMHECDLPRAEAELIFSIHLKSTHSD